MKIVFRVLLIVVVLMLLINEESMPQDYDGSFFEIKYGKGSLMLTEPYINIDDPMHLGVFSMGRLSSGDVSSRFRYRYANSINVMVVNRIDSTDYYGFIAFSPQISVKVLRRFHPTLGLSFLLGYGNNEWMYGLAPYFAIEYALKASSILVKTEIQVTNAGFYPFMCLSYVSYPFN